MWLNSKAREDTKKSSETIPNETNILANKHSYRQEKVKFLSKPH
jgi:hypothetical protein